MKIWPVIAATLILLATGCFYYFYSYQHEKKTVASTQIIFTGDIMLSREVLHEIEQRPYISPWNNLKPLFSHADWIVGNLEGAFGSNKHCLVKQNAICFAIPPPMVYLLKQAGFTAIGIENNHSADLGNPGRRLTRKLLIKNNIIPLNFAESPGFIKLGNSTIAIITLSNIPGQDGEKVTIPSFALLQKLRLARTLADFVIVYLHWGNELMDWPQATQQAQATWLIKHGADVIIGHHPHVVQPAECLLGKPTFFSLGNQVFDQKYPETKKGLMAVCQITNGNLQCGSIETITPENSTFPLLKDKTPSVNLLNCIVPAKTPLVVNGDAIHPVLTNHQLISIPIRLEGIKSGMKIWTTENKNILSLETFQPDKNKKHALLFILEKHYSSIDHQNSPRPYVYEVTPNGLVAKWRGSALAWPLLDSTFIQGSNNMDFLCALHKQSSFLLLNNNSDKTRTAVYQWNGFGFSGIQEQKLDQQCQKIFNLELNIPQSN